MAFAETPLAPGFADPVQDGQSVFRALLDAMAHPGRVVGLPVRPHPVGAATPAALAVLLSLADADTAVWLDPPARGEALPAHLRFHCGCPITEDPRAAGFALVSDAAGAPPLAAFGQGTPDYPDRSTTVILQVDELREGEGLRLTGPGIETEARLRATPLPDRFRDQMAANRAAFPLGVDLILAAGTRLAALPRSVIVEA